MGTRLARARNVDSATRACVEGIVNLFPESTGCLYLEDRHQSLKLVAQEPVDVEIEPEVFDELAAAAVSGDHPVSWHDLVAPNPHEVVAVALRARGKALGALVVARDDRFDEDDVRVV